MLSVHKLAEHEAPELILSMGICAGRKQMRQLTVSALTSFRRADGEAKCEAENAVWKIKGAFLI